MFAGNAYYRNIKTSTYNGDINGDAFADTVSFSGTKGEVNQNYKLTSYAGAAYDLQKQIDVCLAQNRGTYDVGSTLRREAGEKCNGLINRTRTNQENAGLFAQISVENEIFKRPNSYILGAGYDFSRSRFSKTVEYGSLAPGGSIVGSGYFSTENRDKPQNLNDVLDARDANVKNLTNTWSLLGSDTLALKDNLHLTASGRYNYVRVKAADQNTHHLMDAATDLMTSDIDSDASLSGSHTFARFNPSLGLTFVPIDNLTTYAKYGEGSRAPTAMELTCANPNAPCSLPNAMAGDPSLKQVISKTFEGGFRGKAIGGIAYNLNAYNTRLVNDIQFIQAAVGSGYFTNFGETQRIGFD
jgi:outer membrane receptor protein involved in Fe transport